MTRGDIKNKAKALVRAFGGVPFVDDPFILDFTLDSKTNDLAKMVDGVWATYTDSIVSGQATYCPANLYEVVAVFVTGSDGARHRMPKPQGTVFLERYDGSTIDPGTPQMAIIKGLNIVELVPTPNYSLADAIVYQGFGIPESRPGKTNTWYGDTSECPLPLDHHEAIVWGLAAAMAPMGTAPISGAYFEQEYWNKTTMIQSNANAYTLEIRTRDNRLLSSGSLYPGDPLNQGWYSE